MAARPQLPGMRWFLWLRNIALRVGVLVWIYVSCAFAAWQLVSYRIPQLERFAGVRDITAGAVILALLAIPIFYFHREPARLFLSGLTAWTLLTITYTVAESLFSLIGTRMSGIQIFMLGAFSYGLAAVFHWVFLICVEARHRHLVQTGQAPSPASRSRAR